MRLTSSIAVDVDLDILLMDEDPVGDHTFQSKCLERMPNFRRRGKTILSVPHASGMVQRLCTSIHSASVSPGPESWRPGRRRAVVSLHNDPAGTPPSAALAIPTRTGAH
jgi:hypothetical protein